MKAIYDYKVARSRRPNWLLTFVMHASCLTSLIDYETCDIDGVFSVLSNQLDETPQVLRNSHSDCSTVCREIENNEMMVYSNGGTHLLTVRFE